MCFVALCKDNIDIAEDNLRSQLYLFTIFELIEHILEIFLAYYIVELISKLLCYLIAKLTAYKPISIVATLGWPSIISWGVAIALTQDAAFTGFVCCTVRGQN